MSKSKSWFGPSKEEIWKQLASEIGANYVEGAWSGAKVQAQYGEWTITLDTFTESNDDMTEYGTRIRAPYVNKDGFRFNISRRNFVTDIAKLFGMQDVEVGHPDFDDAFIIQGNDEKKLCVLFAHPKIRELIQSQSTIGLWVRSDQGWFSRIFPKGVDELCFQAGGIIKDVERLKALFDLFAITLDHLCEMGSAYEKAPGVVL